MKKTTFFLLFFIILGTAAWGQDVYTWGGYDRTDIDLSELPNLNWDVSDNWFIGTTTQRTSEYPCENGPEDATVIFDSTGTGTVLFLNGADITSLEINADLTAGFSDTAYSLETGLLVLNNSNFALSDGTINIQNLQVVTNGLFTSTGGSLLMNGAPVIISSAEVAINPYADAVIGDINALNHDIIINSFDGNIIINGDITTNAQIILTASSGNIIINGSITGAQIELVASGNITFTTTGDITGTQIILNATNGNVYIHGNISGQLEINAPGGNVEVDNSTINGITGASSITADNITLGSLSITGGGNSLTLTGSSVLNGGAVGALQITGNAVFQTAPLTAGSISVTGNAEFQTALTTGSVNVTGTSLINTGIDIHTTGNQTYSGAITLTGTGNIELISDSGSVATGAGITGTTVTTGTGLSISAGSDINLTNSINARNIILRANGDVTITGIGNIVAGDVPLPPGLCDYAVPNVVIYIKAVKFDASGFSGIITPGTSGELCLDTVDFDLGLNASVAGDRFHKHIPPMHLVYAVTVPNDLLPLSHIHINPLIDNDTSFSADPGSNIYIVDVGDNQNGEVTFTVNGNGFIEIRGNYSAPGLILHPGDGGVNLVGANIELTDGPFSSDGRQVTLRTPASSITAPNITLGAITGGGNSLVLTGNAVLNGGSGLLSLTVNGNSSINADISSTGTQMYDGSVTLGSTANPVNLTADNGGLITFGSTVTGIYNSCALAVTNANVIFNGPVSGLASIAINGGGNVTVNTGTITTTTGGQTYSGTVSLGEDVNFTGNVNTLIHFMGTVNGAFSFTVTTANVQFNNTVTSNNLNVTSGRTILNGDIAINAGAITFNQLQTINGGTVIINNSDLYTQNGAVTASGIFSQTGSGDVLLSGNITATNPVRNDAKISFISEVTLGSNVILEVPSTGGFVDIALVVMNNSSVLSFAGGSQTQTLEIQLSGSLGNVSIKQGSYAEIKSGATITQNDSRTLTLEENAVLDTSAGTWHIGAGALTSDDFAGVNGTLTLGTQSKLITADLYLIESTFTVNNSGWATIAVKGDLDVSAVNFNNANLPRLIFEMIGNGTQSLNAQRIGSLHVKPGSQANLTGNLEISGEVEILYRDITLPGLTGVLNAGSHNIVMYAGLAETKNLNGTNTAVNVGRWRIIGAPENVSSGTVTTHDMYAFLQEQSAGIEFKKASPSDRSFFEVIGNTVWQKFKCTDSGVTFQFSMYPDQHIFTNTFEIKGNATNPITLTRYIDPSDLTKTGWRYIYDNNYMPPGATDGASVDNGLPTVPAPRNLKDDVNERIKFWNFNLITTGTELSPLMDISYIDIYFSHAWNQAIQISSQLMNIKAVPFYRPPGPGNVPPRTGCFNYGWIEIRKIIYSFVEDSNGNGKVDRIRVQTSVPLNGNFSKFTVAVEGYTVRADGYEMVNELTGDADDIFSFYIYLEEKSPYLYDGQPLSWRITRNDDSLKDTTSQPFLVGDPRDGEVFVTINTIPPRISYALTLPGHNETYVRISQPVTGALIVGGNANDFTVQQTSPPPDYELEGFNLQTSLPVGVLSYRLGLNSSPDVSDLAVLARIGDAPSEYFSLQGLTNLSVRAIDWSDELADSAAYMYYPSPRYPKDWNYSEYAEYAGNSHIAGLSPDLDTSLQNDIFIPPYRLLTPQMMRMLEDYAAQRTTAKVTPDMFLNGGDVVERRSTDVLVSMPFESESSQYFALPVWARYLNAPKIIQEFDGKEYLEDSDNDDITLQARIFNSAAFSGLRLFYGFNVPAEVRSPEEAATGSLGGLWLPKDPLQAFNPLFDIVPSETINFDTGLLGFYSGGGSSPSLASDNQLVTFNIPNDSFSSGGKIEFLLRLEGNSTADPNLFVARLDVPRGADFRNTEWWTMIRPFSFNIQNIRRQRGGVTILNNVINSDIGEVTYLRYSLARPGRVTIQVYTLDGTLVKSLIRNEQRAAGEWAESWNGTNNGGRPVARGMYFVRVVGPDIDEIRKVMVIR